MKILIAFDSFKGSLSAEQACKIVADTFLHSMHDVIIVEKPLADGGEGTAQAMITACGGRWIQKNVMGPKPDMKVNSGFAWLNKNNTTLVEMASASGITLLKNSELDPYITTTYGTGELIKAAVELKPDRLLLAVGGSATVDGGVGAAMALGYKFLDQEGRSIGLGGAALTDIVTIVPPKTISLPEIDVLCDIENPLCGPNGAARVFAPQKGATPEMVLHLEKGLENLATVVRKDIGVEMDIPKAGAAGGLSAGAFAFMNAKLISGIKTVLSFMDIDSQIADSDLVITGEGAFDSQSLQGKVISGVVELAKKNNIPVAVIAGTLKLTKEQWENFGISHAISCKDKSMSLECAIENAEQLLRLAALKLADSLSSDMQRL